VHLTKSTHLLDGRWKSLARVFGFSGRETHEFRAGKCEGRCHKGAAEALESVMKGSRMMPKSKAHIASVGSAIAVNSTHDVDEDSQKTE
jgi:hypothetical protein